MRVKDALNRILVLDDDWAEIVIGLDNLRLMSQVKDSANGKDCGDCAGVFTLLGLASDLGDLPRPRLKNNLEVVRMFERSALLNKDQVREIEEFFAQRSLSNSLLPTDYVFAQDLN